MWGMMIRGNDTLYGYEGNDALNGGGGSDVMEGGEGNDVYYVDNSGDTVTEELSEGTDIVYSWVTLTTPDNVENLTLYGSSDIDGVGNDLANTIRGNSGNNELSGGDGTDTLLDWR